MAEYAAETVREQVLTLGSILLPVYIKDDGNYFFSQQGITEAIGRHRNDFYYYIRAESVPVEEFLEFRSGKLYKVRLRRYRVKPVSAKSAFGYWYMKAGLGYGLANAVLGKLEKKSVEERINETRTGV